MANAERKVEGVKGERRISRIRKGNVFSSYATPASMNALETIAQTEKQQEPVQVCKNNLVRTDVGIKLDDRRKFMK